MRFLLLCDALDSTREDPPLQPLSSRITAWRVADLLKLIEQGVA